MSQGISPQSVNITIADFAISIQTCDGPVARRLQTFYEAFLNDGRRPDIVVDLKITPGALFIEPEPGPWVIESSYDDKSIGYRSYTSRGSVNLRTRQATLEMAPDASLENFLRVVYAWWCLQNDGLLLHAAGIVRQGQGFVFFGPSGAGKTTTARLSTRNGTILSDDLVIIRHREDGYWLYGVPFRGDLSDAPRANQRAPLRGIFRLQQDREHRIEAMPPTRGIAELAAASPFLVDKQGLHDRLISVCHDLVRQVAVQTLHFKPDDGFWKVIDGYFADVPKTTPTDIRPGYRW